MDHAKLDQIDLDFPYRELSVRDHRFAVALSFFLQIYFSCVCTCRAIKFVDAEFYDFSRLFANLLVANHLR